MRTLLITHCLVLSARFASLKINNNGTSLGAVLTYIANDRKHLFRTEVDVFRWTGGRSPTKRVFKHSEFHDLVRSLLSVDKYNRPSV